MVIIIGWLNPFGHYYRIKRFFSWVQACVSGADAIANCKHVWMTFKCRVCECIGTVYTCMNSWKEPFNTYNSSIWIFSLFLLLNWLQACFQSDTIVVSRWSSYCLCWLYKKSSRVINGSNTQKSPSSYERIQNKQVTMLLCNQKARKRYTLTLYELVLIHD